jgi:hypothetical protein
MRRENNLPTAGPRPMHFDIEDFLDDLKHLEESFKPPASHVTFKLTREEITGLIQALDAMISIKRVVGQLK